MTLEEAEKALRGEDLSAKMNPMTVLYPNEITYRDIKYALRQDRGPWSFAMSTIEILEDKGLFDAVGYHITEQDHVDILSKATRNFVDLPARCRMRGMIVDLNHDERRSLCFVDAVIEVLNRKGYVDQSKIMGPAVYTEVQEVNNEETYGGNITQQKK